MGWGLIDVKRIISNTLIIVKLIYCFVGIVGIFLLFYFVYDIHNPFLSIHGGEVINDHVRPGDTLKIDWRITTYRSCYVEVDRHIWGQCGVFQIQGYYGNFPGTPRLTEDHHIRVKIPELAEPGICHYRAKMKIYCNPLAEIFPDVQEFPDIPFEIEE